MKKPIKTTVYFDEELLKQISAYVANRRGISQNRAITELITIGLENTKNAAIDESRIISMFNSQLEEKILPLIRNIDLNLSNASIHSIAAALLNAELVINTLADDNESSETAYNLWMRSKAKAAELNSQYMSANSEVNSDIESRINYDSSMEKKGDDNQ